MSVKHLSDIFVDGKVGVNNSSPNEKLEVDGAIRANAYSANLILNSTNTTGGRTTVYATKQNGSLSPAQGYIQWNWGQFLEYSKWEVRDPNTLTNYSSIKLPYNTSGGDFEIDLSANTALVIGRTALDVGIDNNIYHLGDTDTKFGFVANDNFAISTAGTERVRVTSGGSVGVGTNNPAEKLHVKGSGASTSIKLESGVAGNTILKFENNGGGNGSSGGASHIYFGTYNTFPQGPDDDRGKISYYHNLSGGLGNDYMSFTTNSSERLRIKGDGAIQQGNSSATGQYAAALNQNNTASSLDAFATGENTTASGRQAFSGGFNTTASGDASFAVGATTVASANQSFAAGAETNATGIASAAFNALTDATGVNSFAIGGNTTASGESSFSGGVSSTAHGLASVALGLSCNSYQNGSISGGTVSSASNYSIGWGDNANATGVASQAFGYLTTSAGSYTFAAGFNNSTVASASAVFGQQNNFNSSCNRTFGSGFFNSMQSSDSAVFGSYNGFTWNTSTTPSNQFMLGKYLNVPRAGSNGAASDSCTIVGKHNGYTNLANAAFVVGTGVGVGAEQNSFTVQHDGNVLMEQIVNKNYSSDSAAAAGGVPVGGIYHNSGDLKIRLT